MKETVHILATVRKLELLRAATLVFDTLRVGFPSAGVCVWGNGLERQAAVEVRRAAERVGCSFHNLPGTSHDGWVESLVERSLEPFWICDTDVVFFGEVQSPESKVQSPECLFAGRFEPEFMEEWTGTRKMERLHTAVMWLDAPRLRSAMREWIYQFPEPWRCSAEFPFIRQHFIPVRGQTPVFYDTCAGLWHALGPPKGRAFTEAENDCFEHLHCGTYLDLVAPHLQGMTNMARAHAAVWENPQLARGIRAGQDKYYAKRSPKLRDGELRVEKGKLL